MKLCPHVYPIITIAMAKLHVFNQWQLASGNEYVFALYLFLQPWYSAHTYNPLP